MTEIVDTELEKKYGTFARLYHVYRDNGKKAKLLFDSFSLQELAWKILQDAEKSGISEILTPDRMMCECCELNSNNETLIMCCDDNDDEVFPQYLITAEIVWSKEDPANPIEQSRHGYWYDSLVREGKLNEKNM